MIPVSKRQDTIGPIARTVKDVAQILDVAVQLESLPARYCPEGCYTATCGVTDLHGVRIGVVEYSGQDIDQPKTDAFCDALDILAGAGATLVKHVRLDGFQDYMSLPDRMKNIVLDTEFKTDNETYLRSLAQNPRRILPLEDLLDAIKSEHLEEYPSRYVDVMLRALNTSRDCSEYVTMLQKEEYYANDGGFEGAMDRYGCDVLIRP